MKPTFQNLEDFAPKSDAPYKLLPFNFGRISSQPNQVILTNDFGEYVLLGQDKFDALTRHKLSPNEDLFYDLRAKHFVIEGGGDPHVDLLAAKYRTRKSFLRYGPSLHIFVVTLRCDHSCVYCQVSRQSTSATEFDMSAETINHAVDRLFESRSPNLTVEFQGGEPALAFSVVENIVRQIEERNASGAKNIQFTMVSTLHLMSDDMLKFCRDHKIGLSTSLDGPEFIHNANRPNRTKDSFRKTITAINRARDIVGIENVAALTTLTRESLKYPTEIIDTYIEHGFRSIFLRPLSPYGFAVRSERKIGYSVGDFIAFYKTALQYLIKINLSGIPMDEAYTSILLGHILTPFPSNYMDLRSPAGAGLGSIVYNYDGQVYASDEGRMLAETADDRFALGHVSQSLSEMMRSDAMNWILASGVAEALPGCSDCAFLPYCGADPVFHAGRQGDPVGHRPTSEFCQKQLGVFDVVFSYLTSGDEDAMRVFLAWLGRRSINEVPSAA